MVKTGCKYKLKDGREVVVRGVKKYGCSYVITLSDYVDSGKQFKMPYSKFKTLTGK